MSEGITVKVLGDFGPFSSMGKNIGYELEINGSRYLIDCGAPVFQQVGGNGLRDVNGLIITHCHDDHKRWFTDLALFNIYAADFGRKVTLITSEDIHQDLVRSSASALDRTLSLDARFIIDVPYEDYISPVPLGPKAKYRITTIDEGNGKTSLRLLDRGGKEVDSDQGKIVISARSKRPRMLFRDPASGEWVEPESFYPFSSNIFYEQDQNIFREIGFTIEALKSPVWHGLTTIGLKINTDRETLIFSSDTNHDERLWERLHKEKREQKRAMSDREFNEARIIVGDINDYTERTWSSERYEDAMKSFRNGIVIHDISFKRSVVHTEYSALKHTSLKRDRGLLTHSPDKMTSEWVLCDSGKTFRILKDTFFEVVGDRLLSMNADIYHKEGGRFFVGYRNDSGSHTVYEGSDGYLMIDFGEIFGDPVPKFRVDLYEDIGGKYFPVITEESSSYIQRHDGNVELIRFNNKGSQGMIASDKRSSLPSK